MTRLPIVDFRTMERVLLKTVFQSRDRRGVTSSTNTPMEERPLFLITQAAILPAFWSTRS